MHKTLFSEFLLKFLSDPCILYSMTNYCVMSKQQYTHWQSILIRLDSNLRLTVHLRLSNWGEENYFNKTKDPLKSKPQPIQVV